MAQLVIKQLDALHLVQLHLYLLIVCHVPCNFIKLVHLCKYALFLRTAILLVRRQIRQPTKIAVARVQVDARAYHSRV